MSWLIVGFGIFDGGETSPSKPDEQSTQDDTERNIEGVSEEMI